jgi:hypothetical protein
MIRSSRRLVEMYSRIHFRVEDADNANRTFVDTIEDNMFTGAEVAQTGRQVITNRTELGICKELVDSTHDAISVEILLLHAPGSTSVLEQ